MQQNKVKNNVYVIYQFQFLTNTIWSQTRIIVRVRNLSEYFIEIFFFSLSLEDGKQKIFHTCKLYWSWCQNNEDISTRKSTSTMYNKLSTVKKKSANHKRSQLTRKYFRPIEIRRNLFPYNKFEHKFRLPWKIYDHIEARQ